MRASLSRLEKKRERRLARTALSFVGAALLAITLDPAASLIRLFDEPFGAPALLPHMSVARAQTTAQQLSQGQSARPLLTNPAAIPSPQPVPQPEPVETPIGTEAATLGTVAELPEPLIEFPATITLSFASWDMTARKSNAVSASPTARPTDAPESSRETTEEPPRVWRHTFGAERTSAPWRHLPKPGITSDVIAIRGVQKLIDIRQHFNAQDYHVVASQQLLARSAAASTGRVIFRFDAPATTALAFRRRRGVRIAGFRHFLPPVTPQASGTERLPEPPAITAFRLRIYGKLLWVATIDIPPSCAISQPLAAAPANQRAAAATRLQPSSECAPHDPVLHRFLQWSATLATENAPLAVIGRWPSGLPGELQRLGMTIGGTVASRVSCSPAPTGMLIAMPKAAGIKSAEWAEPETSPTNPCIDVAELVLGLRDPLQ